MYTFEQKKLYQNPTETVDIGSIKTVKSDDNTNTNIFVFLYYLKPINYYTESRNHGRNLLFPSRNL